MSMLFVGPSECDGERQARTEEAGRIWNELMKFIIDPHETHLLLSSSFDLFREALSCYQNGAFMGTTLACRSATEVAVYLLLFRRPVRTAGKLVSIKQPTEEVIEEIGEMERDLRSCQRSRLGERRDGSKTQ